MNKQTIGIVVLGFGIVCLIGASIALDYQNRKLTAANQDLMWQLSQNKLELDSANNLLDMNRQALDQLAGVCHVK